MSTPYFSIVIPTYNRAGFILKTIHSLLEQQYSDFEILVVDDGSTDNTEQVMKEITDVRVIYHKKQNAERGAARNFGARRAKGQYINFFDSDDVAYNNHLGTAHRAAARLNNPEVFHLGYDVKDADGVLLKRADRFPTQINEALIDGNHLSCNGVFLRKDVALSLPFSENRALSGSEDYALWLRVASRYPFHCVNEITSTVVNHEARSVVTIQRDRFLQRIGLLQEEMSADGEFIRRYGAGVSKFRAFLNIYIALHLAMAGRPRKESLPFLTSAVKLRPVVVFDYRFLAALKNIIV